MFVQRTITLKRRAKTPAEESSLFQSLGTKRRNWHG
jgi:hypothetical protein